MRTSKEMIIAFMKCFFKSSAEEFASNPSGLRWLRLDIAMWALQKAHNLTNEEAITFMDARFCDIPYLLAKRHKENITKGTSNE